MASSAKTWLPAIALLLDLSVVSAAGAAQYVVDGLALGSRAPLDSQNYRSYDCKPSNDFADLTWCQRSQQKSSRGRNVTVSNTIAHATDGTNIYLMVNVAPVTLNRSIIQNEIVQLSNEIGEQPAKVEWFSSQRPGLPTSVIVYWGQIKLERLGEEDRRIVADGKSPRLGVLVDSLGDLARSAKDDFPVYRMAGGLGYLYAASFDESGLGHRHYVAINGAQLAVRHFERALQAVLQKDRNLASNDYQLWPEVAAMTRRLALDTSAKTANELLDKVFDGFSSKKLRSHVWSILPGGTIIHLATHQHGTVDVYGPKTEHPAIRRTIQRFLVDKPSEPFAEFLHYTIGDYEKALATNPNSIVSDVLHYAVGYDKLGSLARETIKIVDPSKAKEYEDSGIDGTIGFLNEYSERSDSKRLSDIVPNFAARAATIRVHFEAVLRNGSARHADDAAYMLGWLTLHQGKRTEALPYFGQAMVLGTAITNTLQFGERCKFERQYSPREQAAMVESNRNLARQPVLWYVAARAAYRQFDYALAVDAAQRALKALDVPLDRLPATTDPRSIDSAIEKVKPELRGDYNISEIPYLLEASREISRYLNTLNSAATDRPDVLTKRARTIIIKYSKLVDVQEQRGQRGASSEFSHRDLRQALYMIDKTLERAPKNAQFARLREWLYYRKIRVLVAFEYQKVPDTVAAMEKEFPTSALMDDALAELIFVQGLMLKDLNSAQNTFRKLIDNFPRGNAVDNAYTWMAIIYRCEGRVLDAQSMNREIIRRFAATRHAMYAQERMANPTSCHG